MTPLDLANARINRLEAEIESLKADIVFYRRQAEIERADEAATVLAARLGAAPQVAWLITMLMESGARGLTHSFILHNLPARRARGEDREADIVRVLMCRVRRILGADAIATIWGRGYALTQKGRELVARVAEGHLDDLPAPRPLLPFGDRRKLSPEAVRVMRRADQPEAVRALAAAYGCSTGLVYGVRSGELYADVGP